MVSNIIRIEDNVYQVVRILSNTTTEEQAKTIHEYLETNALLKDKEGKWFCCNQLVDAEFNDVENESKIDQP